MKNKLSIIIVFLISFMIIGLKVNAAGVFIPGQEPDYTEYKNKYNAGISKISINSTGDVTIYGKSTCDGTSCKNEYVKGIDNYEKVLQQAVTCTNGEKYITAKEDGTGRANPLIYSDSANTKILNGIAYWSEDYTVTCVKNSTDAEKVITITPAPSTGNTSNNGTSNSGTSNGGSSDYDSSTTVDSSQTGVSTYFIVLGVIAILSYGLMYTVKKYNLFKNI